MKTYISKPVKVQAQKFKPGVYIEGGIGAPDGSVVVNTTAQGKVRLDAGDYVVISGTGIQVMPSDVFEDEFQPLEVDAPKKRVEAPAAVEELVVVVPTPIEKAVKVVIKKAGKPKAKK